MKALAQFEYKEFLRIRTEHTNGAVYHLRVGQWRVDDRAVPVTLEKREIWKTHTGEKRCGKEVGLTVEDMDAIKEKWDVLYPLMVVRDALLPSQLTEEDT